MLVPHKPVYWLAVMVLVVFTFGHCQENDSRRAVTEHQLMHDRGRTIQSLKRLIWLSSAIEGLHTAQTRSAFFNPTKAINLGVNPALVPGDAEKPQPAQLESQHRVAMDSLLRDFFNPYLMSLPEREQ